MCIDIDMHSTGPTGMCTLVGHTFTCSLALPTYNTEHASTAFAGRILLNLLDLWCSVSVSVSWHGLSSHTNVLCVESNVATFNHSMHTQALIYPDMRKDFETLEKTLHEEQYKRLLVSQEIVRT